MVAPAVPSPTDPNSGARPVFDSLTIRGILVALAPVLAGAVGLDPSQFVTGADALIQLVGLGLAIWGRLRVGDLHWPWGGAA